MKNIRNLVIAVCLLTCSFAYATDYVDGYKAEDLELSIWSAIAAPSVSATNTGRIYYDGTADTLKLSLNGGAYYDLITSSSGSSLYWLQASDQTLLTGDKSGSFDLTTTGILKVGQIDDSSDDISIDPNNRYLVDSGGSTIFNWETSTLYDTLGVSSIDTDNRYLYDSLGNLAIDWSADGSISLDNNNLTTTGQVQAEHLYSTDDLVVDDDSWLKSQVFIGGVTATEGPSPGDLGLNLVSRWTMDDNAASTTVVDDIGGKNGTAEANTDTKTVAGKLATALTFNGSSDFISVADDAAWDLPANNFTISAWVYWGADVNSLGFGQYQDANNFWGIYYFPTSNQFIFYDYSSGACKGDYRSSNGSFSPTLSTWYHLFVVGTPTSVTYYINNSALGSTVLKAWASPGTKAAPLTIGKYHTSVYHNGRMDSVRIYSRVLNAAERAALYNASSGTTSTAPLSSGAAHQAIATSATYTSSHSLDSLKDLAIEGELEVNGDSYFDEDILQLADSKTITQGAGSDYTQQFNGTNQVFTLTSGYFNFTGGVTLFSDKVAFTQTDLNEYIDSLADGYLDLGATTAIRMKNITLLENALYFTQTDGAEKIDSDADGDLDYYAGTSHDFIIGSTEQITLTDGKLAPTTDSDIDLGDTTHYFKDAYIDSITSTGQIQAADLYATDDLTVDDDSWLKSQVFIGGVTSTADIYDIGSNLVGHWLMNDNAASTTVLDNIGANNGTAQQNTSSLTTAGKINTALSFNGSTDYIQLSSNGTGTFNSQSATITMWVKTPASWGAISDYRILFSYDYTAHSSPYYSYQLRFNSGAAGSAGKLYFAWNDGSTFRTLEDPDAAPTNEWVFVAAVYTSGRQEIWINETKVASGTRTDTITFYNQEVWLGKSNFATSKAIAMDDVRFYTRALSAGEIAGVRNGGSGTESESTTFQLGNLHQVIATSSNYVSSHSLDSLADLAIEGELEVNGDTFHDDDVHIIDSKYIKLGTADDATIGYDVTNLVINPKAVGTGVLSVLGDISILDEDFILGTTTGTKFGTGTTQKIGFWNVTPIVQPANTVAIDTLLINTGLWATGASYSPFDKVILAKDKIAFTQTDLNEYIDSLADGYLDLGATTAIRLNSAITRATGDMYIGNNGDVDYALVFDGATNDGQITWMEGEDYFEFADKVLLDDALYFTQTDGNEYIDSLADGYMDYGATTRHRFNAPISIADKTLLGTPVAGTLEFDNDRVYLTNVATQRAIDRTSDVTLSTETVSDTTDETIVFTGLIPADSLRVGNILKLHMAGTIDETSAADLCTIRVYFGSTLMASVVSPGAGTSEQGWQIEGYSTIRSIGETGSMAWRIRMEVEAAIETDCGVDTVDTTDAENVTVTAQWNNAKAGNVFNFYQGFMQYKN